MASSGLLSRKLGGPSVYPPQPDGIWTQNYSGERWETSQGEDRYRRGIYTVWRRTAPYPSFMAFDAPSRELCTARRSRTNTPLQALTTLNDPAFFEAAQALAPNGPRSRSRTGFNRRDGFRLCVARTPKTAELDRLLSLFDRERLRYRADLPGLQALTGSKTSTPEIADLAAWTVLANVLLNLDETITKE